MSGNSAGCHNRRVLLAARGWGPGVLLNVLHGTGRPQAKNDPAQTANAHVEKPGGGESCLSKLTLPASQGDRMGARPPSAFAGQDANCGGGGGSLPVLRCA